MLILLASLALARPTEGGIYAFEDDDVVTTYDSPAGTVRVWYSTSGPSLAIPDDDDGSGVPDFVEEIAVTAEDVLAVYADAGFRQPISDGDEGGSDAMDVYLVDFAGVGDGQYAAESCTSRPKQCSGYFVMENDFEGYGYSSLSTAIRVLTSHELFHAIQAAYDAEEESWFSEGTAMWAEDLYDPENADFLSYCNAYLEDTGRSLDEPPGGPPPAFSYGTAIWWWFLSNRYGDDVIIDLLEATESGDDLIADMAIIEEERGGSLADDWATFARWNIATGRYAGATESYPFADSLIPPRSEEDGASIEDDQRYYPLAATYYKLEHEGGEVWFATQEDAPELAFSLHPVGDDGTIDEPLEVFAGAAAARSFGDLPAGDYWLVASNPTLADDSTKVLTCLGSAEDVAVCAPLGDTGDTGAPPTDAEGCGCASGGDALGAWLVAAGLLAARRPYRRR